jgi:hypothetical protein
LSQRFDSNLTLRINASTSLAGIFLFVHLGAALLLGVVPLNGIIRAMLWLCLGWSLYYSLRVHALRTAVDAIEVFEVDSDGDCYVQPKGAEEQQPCRVTNCLVHSGVVLLTLRRDGRRWPVNLIIAADAVEAEPFRRLRARLKLQSAAA